MRIDPKLLASSIADQDQEWAEALSWYSESDPNDVVALAMLATADDPQALTEWMADNNDVAEVVQRMVVLVLVEVAQRHAQLEAGA